MFLCANAGPWFVVLGVIFTDNVIVQHLTDYMWIGMDAVLNESHCNKVAKVMQSLRNGVAQLQAYYTSLKPITVGATEIHPCYFPSINSYLDHNRHIIEFQYVKPLESDSTCITFLAMHADRPEQIVIKFVTHYGEEAHRLLTKANMAPRLLHCGGLYVRHGDPTYGDLHMAVMEYIDGMTLDKARRLHQVPSGLRVGIENALMVLHADGFVFGDLWPPNIIITKNLEITAVCNCLWTAKCVHFLAKFGTPQ
jgi:hypothetical protein